MGSVENELVAVSTMSALRSNYAPINVRLSPSDKQKETIGPGIEVDFLSSQILRIFLTHQNFMLKKKLDKDSW